MKDLEKTFATTAEKYRNRLFTPYWKKNSLETLPNRLLKFDSIFNVFTPEIKMNLKDCLELNPKLHKHQLIEFRMEY
ncbi:hypothetical protein SAMN04489761_2284 [Tenacibaculum sp. MAR_2009_124]|uniref:hypothetical protein n=1 Tax=Tenacibaculum sp. MAR_2009_124 TaxID=1250059 RepID=UPI000894C8EB|nr:hypothetical protein [Tenacibaculum sp. MAR_2009_124]SEC17108.1 hypothetical protein SAMN04489761_2284 [Tenacibaculum sp. MAR_2009_124]